MNYETGSITEHNYSSFLNEPDEQVLAAVRAHFITIIPILSLTPLVFIFFLAMSVFGYYLTGSILLLIISVLLSLNVGIMLYIKVLTDWYFHSYIVTNRKILEIAFSPFTSCIMNEILLDQVKVTEVDMHTNGLIFDLLKIGDIMITFDRPTHLHEFELKNIKNYRKVGQILCQELVKNNHERNQENTETAWFRNRSNPSDLLFREELKEANSAFK